MDWRWEWRCLLIRLREAVRWSCGVSVSSGLTVVTLFAGVTEGRKKKGWDNYGRKEGRGEGTGEGLLHTDTLRNWEIFWGTEKYLFARRNQRMEGLVRAEGRQRTERGRRQLGELHGRLRTWRGKREGEWVGGAGRSPGQGKMVNLLGIYRGGNDGLGREWW